MTGEEFERLTEPEALQFMKSHENEDARALALKYQNRKDLPIRAIAEQIYCRKKAIKKIPALAQAGILLEKTALEQCSGEAAASFKKTLLSGRNIIDLTGGLGIDSIYFSRAVDKAYYCEQNPVLFSIFNYNRNLLGIRNIEPIPGDSTQTLENFPDHYFDWIYADPARRFNDRKAVGLQNCEPDVIRHLDLFIAKSRNILLKVSPAIEIGEIKKQLRGLSRFIVVSVDGECKEILLIISGQGQEEEVLVEAVLLSSKDEEVLTFSSRMPCRGAQVSGGPGKYLYEPDPAIIKARLTDTAAEKYKLNPVKSGIDYLTSGEKAADFPGRKFTVKAVLPYRKKAISEYLTVNKISRANISRRDFPDSPERLKKALHLGDGGEDYIFFTRNNKNELIAIFCRKADF